MEDPFLNYFALGLLFFVVIVLVYGIIAIHDIPARIAHARHHPHEDAIHAAGWISLFLLWPFLWIWAMMYRPDRGWGFAHKPGEPTSPKEAVAELEELRHSGGRGEARNRRSINPVWTRTGSPQVSFAGVHRSRRQTVLLKLHEMIRNASRRISNVRTGGH
jgi:Protein of unknown function (DUF3302)